MPDVTQAIRVPATGPGVITFSQPRAGIQWIVSQLANSTQPFRVGSTLTVARNGLYLTSTPLASGDSATGPPFIVLNPSDTLSFTFTGMTAGDTCTATIYYSEQLWSANPQGGYVV